MIFTACAKAVNLGTSQDRFLGGVCSILNLGRTERMGFIVLVVGLTLVFTGGVPFS